MRRALMLGLLLVGACADVLDEDESTPEPIDEAPLPADAAVWRRAADGMPTFVVGTLGTLDASAAAATSRDAEAPASLAALVGTRRLAPSDLRLRKAGTDERGNLHLRYRQVAADGAEVIGGELIIHANADGNVFAMNGSARSVRAVEPDAIEASDAVDAVTADPAYAGMSIEPGRVVYVIVNDRPHRAFEVLVEGRTDDEPVRDRVFVDTATGAIVERQHLLHFGKHRGIYDQSHPLSTPAAPHMVRSEGQAPIGDAAVDRTYDNLGLTYDAFSAYFDRDAFDGDGGGMAAVVNYPFDWPCYSYWSIDIGGGGAIYLGTGVGGPGGCAPPGTGLDVIAHELGHGFTLSESGLWIGGNNEPGAINESLADIFGNFAEAWVDGGSNNTLRLSRHTWTMFEAIESPSRYLCDPKLRNNADYWHDGVVDEFGDEHRVAGIGNLAFCLLARGGRHPRRLTQPVGGVGYKDALAILYDVELNWLTAAAHYSDLRDYMVAAEMFDLGNNPRTRNAIACAWNAVGVTGISAPCNKEDILWREATGPVRVWRMNGTAASALDLTTGLGTDWLIKGTGDFNADGFTDILWQNAATEMKVSFVHGTANAPQQSLTYNGIPWQPGRDWGFQAIGDFDGGGQSDILWRHANTGEVKFWRMVGNRIWDAPIIGFEPNASWQIVAVADFGRAARYESPCEGMCLSARDERSDIVWRNIFGGLRIWFVEDAGFTSRQITPGLAPNVSVGGTGDFDGDGVPDLLLRYPTGEVLMGRLTHTPGSNELHLDWVVMTYRGLRQLVEPQWQVKGVADVNGDGISDIVWRHSTTLETKLWLMSGNVITAMVNPSLTLGASWSIQGTGTFD